MTNHPNELTIENSVLVLIDHQPWVAFAVQSIDRGLMINNVAGLAQAARDLGVPTVLTTVGAQGSVLVDPLFKEISDLFPDISPIARAQDARVTSPTTALNAELVQSLPGFESGYADVNGTRIHYVAGGEGTPLVLLPGWPQTWWEYNRMMPILATRYRVIAVDLRGMGASAKPASGYDKKTMARDIFELVRHLGYERVNVAGHDIGAMVAFSFAANHPEATLKLAILDVPHPDDFFIELRMLPAHGSFGPKIDDAHPAYAWWFAFHQVPELPEKMLEGRVATYQDWMFDYLLLDSASIGPRDRAVYAAAYSDPDAQRAGLAWYRTFTQDVIDAKTYPKLEMPVLGLGSTGYEWLKASLLPKATNARLVRIENSGHFIPEEQPETASRLLIEFFE